VVFGKGVLMWTRVNRTSLLGAAIAVASVGMFGMVLTEGASTREKMETMGKHRIASSQVTLSNLEEFEKQVRHDLPLGTSKENSEAYLSQRHISHSFFGSDPIYGPDGNAILGTLENIGMRGSFRASLGIWIHLDSHAKVRNIVFRVEYL
jgi:hypothetical protein